MCRFRLATSERRKDAAGNWTDHTEWHNVVTFGKTAENCGAFLKKGRQVFVEGRIRTRSWQDQEGQARHATEVVAGNVQFVGGKGAGSAAPETGHDAEENVPVGPDLPGALPAFDDDDIPF